MMNYLAGFFFIFCSYALAIESEFSGNSSLQEKRAWNNKEAENLGQNWSSPQPIRELNGNINNKLSHENQSLTTNAYYRFNQTNLYQHPYFVNEFINFPQNFVSRGYFDLEHTQRSGQSQSQYLLNQLSYQYDSEKIRLTLGRHLINYGLGEIFNPINPFAFPTGLVMANNFVQGNDGVSVQYTPFHFLNITYSQLYNKNLVNHDVEKTHWLKAEVQSPHGFELLLVGGQDQRSKQIGGQVNWQGESALYFVQFLKRWNYGATQKDPLDLGVGIDLQASEAFHTRLECGYQELENNTLTLNQNNRFLPMKYFCASANTYEIHPLVKMSMTGSYDPRYRFFLGIFKTSYRIQDNVELSFNLNAPIRFKKDATNLTQKLIPTIAGLSLDAYF